MSTTKSRALVAHELKDGQKPGENWTLNEISVPNDLKDGELLIQMSASGICHTDLITTSFPSDMPGMAYPRIAGHEGSGYVKVIGPNVTKDVAVGDPVLLSFDHCTSCESCQTSRPSYCHSFFPLNIMGSESIFQTPDGKPIAGKSFGQSSFASLSVVNQACVLPAKGLVKGDDELHLFAPLGCGIQTGVGAVLNVAKPVKEDRVMILGLGGVGLSAVMAAKISGAHQIIAVDKIKSRIEFAKTLGATHGLDTTGVEDVVAKLKEIAGGVGPTICIDTTGFTPVLQAGYDSIAPCGTFVVVGASPDKIQVDIQTHLLSGRKLLGCCEGSSVPKEFIPKLIDFYRNGKLPIDKMSKFYKADDFEKALHDMHSGETIKAILLW